MGAILVPLPAILRPELPRPAAAQTHAVDLSQRLRRKKSMKTTLALLALALALPACTRVIERPSPAPSVVTTPAISERTIERNAAAAGTTAPNCTWQSQTYSNGATTCQMSAQHRCNNGIWERTAVSC